MNQETIEYLPLDSIDTAPQVRENAMDDSIRNLAVTLREAGLQQPIRVRRSSDGFVVVDGERRLHAARLLQWDRIAAIVEEGELSGTEVVQRQLIANCMRKNLSSMEMARAIDALVKGTNRSKGDVGNMIGLTGPTVSKYLAMLELPPAMQEHVASGALPYSKAYEIRSEEDPAKQSELVERAVKGKLTRDAASAAVKKSKRGRKGAKRPRKRNDAISLKDGRMVTVSGAESSYESWIAALLEAAEVLKTAQADGIAIDKFQKTSKARPAA